jgi:hypothetical protein
VSIDRCLRILRGKGLRGAFEGDEQRRGMSSSND